MSFISVFNDVLGPVMRGPSSSHTAGSYHIGRLALSLLGEEPRSAVLTFDPRGSYARVWREQAADRGFAAGLLGWSIEDRRFPRALDEATERGLRLRFRTALLEPNDHPNRVAIDLVSRSGRKLSLAAKSVGGGAVVFTRLESWPMEFDGKTYGLFVEAEPGAERPIQGVLGRESAFFSGCSKGGLIFLEHHRSRPWPDDRLCTLHRIPGVRKVWRADPIFFVCRGRTMFESAKDITGMARRTRRSLGEMGLEYESRLLGLSKPRALAEMLRRYDIMTAAVRSGLRGRGLRLALLEPSASRVWRAAAAGRVAAGGLHTRAAARALAVLHVSNSMGLICAAPTGGSSGVVPAVVMTLAEERKLSRERIGLGLFAAGAVGLVFARRATFAAEVAGCQMEIGAAAAMAAAAVVEAARGSAGKACDAAAVCLQNSMGSVCDLVQGLCEIPCHTRNASAASAAFVSADLVLGGYRNPIPLDETIDASLSVGRMLPSALRVTSLAGLAAAPSARRLRPRR